MLSSRISKLLLALVVMAFALVGCATNNESDSAESNPQLDQQAIVDAVIATITAQEIAQEQEEAPLVAINNGALAGNNLETQLQNLYNQVNPSVVFILNFAGFATGGTGSGFVYDADGHIVTNNHVVEGAQEIEVVFADGSRSKAELVGTDIDSDLAVIRVETLPESVPPLPLSSLDDVSVGQFVIAIGNPFGEQGSMSLGIVSGLGRSLISQRENEETGRLTGFQLPRVIQTDAPINPGNSGGPLLNLNGEVVGVNSAIRTETGTNSGVGFSIPVDAVSQIAPVLIENGTYTYPYMGVGLDELEIDQADALGFDRTRGAYVTAVVGGSPAASAGLQAGQGTRVGDLIIAIDDQSIDEFDDLNSYLVFNTAPGQTIQITVIRDGGEVIVPLTLGERP